MPKTMAPPTPTNPTRPATTLASTPQGLLTYPAPAAVDEAAAATEEEAPDAPAAADEVMDARTDEAEETTLATEDEAPAMTEETEEPTPAKAELVLETTEDEAEAWDERGASTDGQDNAITKKKRLKRCHSRPTRRPRKGLQRRWQR